MSNFSDTAFGYHTDTVQRQFQARDETGPAAFLLPHLEPGMRLLDVGCGPGTVTLGLAHRIAPASAVGCDLEAGMIARATQLADDAGVGNVSFRTANILDLPFANDEFDVVFSSAVTEHLRNPQGAVAELARVAKPGGLVAITRTDWTGPLMSPDSPAMERFFTWLEAGFNAQGGSMNSGRHIRSMTRAAGLEDVEFFAGYINATTRERVHALVSDYTQWMDNMDIFQQLIRDGRLTAQALADTRAAMWQWADHPDAYLGVTVCRIVTRKPHPQPA